MIRLAVLVMGVAACDGVFGLSTVSGGEDDGGGGGGGGCLTRTPTPFFCADFDDTDPLGYENGLMVTLPTADPDVLVERRAPLISAPNALWITSGGGRYIIDFTPTAPKVRVIKATFEVRLAAYTAGTVGLISIGLRDPAYSHCYVTMQIEPSAGPRLLTKSNCDLNNTYADATILPSLPAGSQWLKIELTLDGPNGIAITKIGTQPEIPFAMGFSTTTGGTPHLAVGLLDAAGTPGNQIAFDDVVVDLTP